MNEKTDNKRVIAIIVGIVIALLAVVAGVILANNFFEKNRIQKMLELGDRYLSEAKYEEAFLTFDKILEIEPNEEKAYEKRTQTVLKWGVDLSNKGEYNDAISVYQRMWNIEKDTVYEQIVGAYLSWAEALKQIEDYERSIAVLEEGYELTGDDRIFKQISNVKTEKEETESKAREMAIITEVVEELAKRCQNNDWDGVFEYMQSQQYNDFLTRYEMLTEQHMFETPYGQIGFYKIDSANMLRGKGRVMGIGSVILTVIIIMQMENGVMTGQTDIRTYENGIRT